MEQSLKRFRLGNQYVNVVSAVSKDELTYKDSTSVDLSEYTMTKFIPASGVATRR